MNKRRSLKTYIRPAAAILLVLALLFGAVFTQQKTIPENPLHDEANNVLMLTAAGKTITSSQDVETPPEEEDEQPPEEDEEEKENQEEKSSDESSDEETNNSGTGNEGTEPGPGTTDIIYFTTSIKDGETITTKSYQFSINHKIPELEPQSTQIYVDGQLVDHIEDARTDFSVLLNEGENILRVQVTYQNEAGKLLSPYKDYLINVDTRNLVINTSLQDGMTVESSYLTFNASAEFGQDPVDLTVTLDGEEVSQFDGVYEAELSEGANVFTMYAASHGQELEQTYTVYYEPPEGLYIDTDLESQTVRAVDGDFTFRAEAVGGGPRTEFTVSVNNKKVEGENGVYHIVLVPQGEKAYNTIRLKAIDDEQEETLTFKIKYIPIATPETEPQIVHINLSDGQTVKKKNPFTLELAAQDYRGNKIYFDGVEVYLNGKRQILRDTKPYITYKLNFVEGSNTVKLVITDDDGRFKEFTYDITYVAPDENEVIGSVTVIMDANVLGKGTLMETEVDLLAGDNLAKAIVRALDKKGFGYQIEGTLDNDFYLAHIEKSGIGMRYAIPDELKQEINDSGIGWKGSEEDPERALDSLGQLDYTPGSGWLILVDGSFITESASAVDLTDGAIVKVRFTLAYGMDIGGSYLGNTFEHTY